MNIRTALSAATAATLAIAISVVAVPAAHADLTTPGTFNTVASQRVLDTRSGIGAPKAALPAQSTLTFAVDTGQIQVGALALEVTAVNPKMVGHLRVYPAGAARPNASNLNFQAGQNVPNLVITKVGTGNRVSVYNGSDGSVDVLADVHGYFLAGANQGDPGTLVPLSPVRLLDTRIGLGITAVGKVGPNSVTRISVAGSNGIPRNASAVALNVTAVQSAGRGYITAYPGSPMPLASSLNYEPRQNRANLSLVQVGTDGTVSLFNGSNATVDLVADVSGYFVGGGTAAADGSFTPSSTARIVDTRTLGSGGFVPALTTLKVQVFPPGDPFTSFIKAISVNVTVANPTAAGFLTTWDGSIPLPAVSSSNFQPRQNVAGSVIVPVNPDGTISIYNGSYGNVDIVVDFTGLFFALPSQNAPTGKISPNGRTAVPSSAQVLSQLKTFISSAHAPTLIARTR